MKVRKGCSSLSFSMQTKKKKKRDWRRTFLHHVRSSHINAKAFVFIRSSYLKLSA
jgi:hypothetical protein